MVDETLNEPVKVIPYELGQFAPYLLNRITHRYNKTLQAELRAAGLTVMNLRIIASLAAFGELTVNELCVHAIAEQSTMSRSVEKMEDEGLVQRSISEDDQRVRIVRLTKTGIEAYERIRPVMSQANAYILQGLSAEERDSFFKLLQKMLESLRKHPI